jgi:nitrite reductase/ring-hydroxylating ferredoxin subunit/uncharacterized membrane protein
MPGLKDWLEGKPLRSPLHPAAVHLPIALLPLGVLLDLATRVFDQPGLGRAALTCLIAGIATGLVAGVLGMVDYTDIRNDHPAKRTATAHMVLNLVALGIFAASVGLRWSDRDATRTATLPLVLSIVAVVLLGYSGYLGGHLVYSDGIAVGRHRRRTLTPDRTVAVSAAPTGAAVAVADATALADGETLRVAIGGVIVTVARVAGGVHAFQEFCTHRYGPLSEGVLRGCEVQCPWHRSRFDIRTGKVTQGPAKVDLRTFRAEIRDGKIWVTVAA